MWLRDLLRSFRYAFQGIFCTARTERNMRIHLTAVAYVTALGFLAELDGPGWTAVLLCFGAVIAAELINTALENVCDVVSPERNPKIGAAKDAAAGAVLALAIASVCVAAVVFGPWLLSGELLHYPWMIAAVIVSLPLAILWIRGNKS
ncbi:Undecaprenol kinase (modular protein) [uncultured Eubacteriales bacterium]|uniref:Undecaprenol kinase (Modular protein) n=1 Tax=uncultured Eubacteriales bacterium TaxID=172733 RepID=A0A212J8P4_9FIRM|nr:Undecaprenol kinase (modular protein) [uncultured Eubacteriales bacterium]